jgi:hypothetical protein
MFDLSVIEQELVVGVGELVPRLRLLETDAARYRWLREGHAVE